MTALLAKKTKRTYLLVLICSILALNSVAQNSSSPYSSYGIGDFAPASYGSSAGLGGSSLAMRMPNSINPSNPATYATLSRQSFIFDIGLQFQQYSHESKRIAQIVNGTGISHMNMAFAVLPGIWNMAAGLLPYTSQNYHVSTYEYSKNVGDIYTNYEGLGGINKVYWGNSVSIVKGLSLGFNLSYMFGSLEDLTSSVVSADNYSSSLTVNNKKIVSDFCLDYGLQYSYYFGTDFGFTVGATLTPKTDLKFRKSLFAVQDRSVSGVAMQPDTIVNSSDDMSNIHMPDQYGVGLALAFKEKLILTGDYKLAKWGETNNAELKNSLSDAKTISLGLEVLPNYRSINYWKRVHYRIGFQTSDTYWTINGVNVKDESVSFGLGFPFRRNFSAIDAHFVVGRRGTTDSGLLKETYVRAGVSISLHDIWFIKRKFD